MLASTSQSTSRILVILIATPHALKMQGQAQVVTPTAIQANEAQRERRPKFWSRRPCGRQGRAGRAPLRGLGTLTASCVVKLARHAHKGSHADQWRRLLSRPAARGRNATAGRRDRTSFQFAGRQLKAMPRFDYN